MADASITMAMSARRTEAARLREPMMMVPVLREQPQQQLVSLGRGMSARRGGLEDSHRGRGRGASPHGSYWTLTVEMNHIVNSFINFIQREAHWVERHLVIRVRKKSFVNQFQGFSSDQLPAKLGEDELTGGLDTIYTNARCT